MGKTVSAELDEDMTKRFSLVKKAMGLGTDADVLRVLISQRYHELTEPKSITVSKGLYDMLGRKAASEGKTIEELVSEIVLRHKKREVDEK